MFNCITCNIGQTGIKFSIRIKEHTKAIEKLHNNSFQNSQYVLAKYFVDFKLNFSPTNDVHYLHFGNKSLKLTLLENFQIHSAMKHQSKLYK